jgi:hypothetical protein
MDAVLDNWIGPAIGGAVGAAAWVAGQVWDVGSNIVNTVVDAVSGATQPQPYEEWLNAPTPAQEANTAEFRTGNETTYRPTAEEVITNVAKQETKTGASSPLGPNDPNEYRETPLAPTNDDPQSPLTPDFQPIQEKAPVRTTDANIVMSAYSPYPWNPDSSDEIDIYATFRGDKSFDFNGKANQFTFAGTYEIEEDGSVAWTAQVQALNSGSVAKTWTWDAGDKPPQSGDFGLWMSIPVYGQLSDLLDAKNNFPGFAVRRYSLSTPDTPGQLTPIPEVFFNSTFLPPEFALQGLTALDPNQPGIEVPQLPFVPVLPLLPEMPVTTSPTQVNNPTTVPLIGTNGLPVTTIQNIEKTYLTTHVVQGQKFNSGGIRKDIAGVAKEVGRIEQKTAAALDKLNKQNGLADLLPLLWPLLQVLADLFEQPLPAKKYELSGVCETPDSNGKQPVTEVTLPAEKFADRLVTQMDIVPALLQAHLGYKTPTCGSTKPSLLGSWVTTRWQSDEKMAHSGRRLRKLFRYRSQSSRDLGQLSAYWESFTWRAGDVCVIHKGAWWGTPQVWAESAEEGKRVIRHAAAEAGLDPDQTGGWEISSSRSPRFGMSGTMRAQRFQGFPWIASRDGSDWPNTLALQRDP